MIIGLIQSIPKKSCLDFQLQLRVMGGCIELRTAWPHHPNNRTRWCAGSAWVKGVLSDCVLSMG